MDDLYDKPAEESEQPDPGMDKNGDEQGEMHEAIANKEAFPEAKPGMRYTVEITQVHDDEVSFRVELMEEGKEGMEGGGEPEMAGESMGGEDSLMN